MSRQEKKYAKSLYHEGVRLFDAGDRKGALSAFMHSLVVYRGIGGTRVDQVWCLRRICRIQNSEGLYDVLLDSCQQAVHLCRDLSWWQDDQAYFTYLSGYALSNLGRYAEALAAYQGSLDLYRGLPDRKRRKTQDNQAECLSGIGMVLHAMNRQEEELTS